MNVAQKTKQQNKSLALHKIKRSPEPPLGTLLLQLPAALPDAG
jgi:hypothetical protein